MFAGRFSLKAFGGSVGSTLDADLKRVTDSGVIEIPKELLDVVSEASNTEENRRTIMNHLRECLAEPSGRRWRRIHAALALVEELVKSGAPFANELLLETSEGRHFDLVQRLSLLEHFECTTDRRVQNMVRSKASTLRSDVVPRLETAGELHDDGRDGRDRETKEAKESSTSSPGMASVASCSTADTQSLSGRSVSPPRPAGRMILNGIVAVGHRDDTSSESSGDEAPRPVSFREAHAGKRECQRPARHSPAPAAPAAPAPAAPARPAQTVDLLEL